MINKNNTRKQEEIIYPNRYNFLDKKENRKLKQKVGKERKKHTTQAIVVALAFLAGFVVLEVFVSSSFNFAAQKSRDLVIKSNLELIASSAFEYYERHNDSFQGFIPQVDLEVASWSGNPVFNVSSDGQKAAIFLKSAEKDSVYFCVEPATFRVDERKKVNIYEVSEDYAKAGNFSCFP